MTTTFNLGLSHIHANQGQKEVTANQFADGLDMAIAGSIMIDLSEKVEYTLTTIEARHAILIFKGELTAPATIIVPTENANKKFIVAHECIGNFSIQFQHINNNNDQVTTLQPNEKRWIYSDGMRLYALIN